LALRTVEINTTLASYLVAFEVPSGRIVLPEVKVADMKLEGLEFA
jgi:hypothetical protein